MNTNPSRVWLSSKVATEMKQEKDNRLKEAAKKAEEKQQRIRDKRAQQLALRAKRKAELKAAVDSEIAVGLAAALLEEARKQRGLAKKKIDRLKEQIKGAEALTEIAEKRAEEAKVRVVQHRAKVNNLQAQLKEAEKIDDNIVEQRSQKLREAWDNSRMAWDRIQKAVRKRTEDRRLKKRVKELLR